MGDFFLYIGTAFALVFVIEGLLYALFPDGIKKLFALALAMDSGALRRYGMVMAVSGFILIYFLGGLSGG